MVGPEHAVAFDDVVRMFGMDFVVNAWRRCSGPMILLEFDVFCFILVLVFSFLFYFMCLLCCGFVLVVFPSLSEVPEGFEF